jgi:Ni/Fe-hydrogenase subunit HybB-like protein
MANGHAATIAPGEGFLKEKILLGMGVKEYLRACCTPWNAVAAIILAVGIPLLVVRFAVGLGATTNLSQTAPWGLWIGFDMMTGIVLAAGGFTIGSAVQIFGLKEYHAIERPAILTAFLGYVMAVIGLAADLGRPWNILTFPLNTMLGAAGTQSALFEVAWCVTLYTTVLALEFTVPLFEWLGWSKLQRVMKKTLIALTVLSVMFSTMHQSALGSLFLLAPTKLHPLWYSGFIFIFFFISAIIAGLCMVIFESTVSHRIFHKQFEGQHIDVEKLQLGLAKAAALVMFAYFFLKLQGVIDGHAWGYLATGWGAWFLVEILGFVLLPSLMFAYGARNGKVKPVRIAAVLGVLGIVLNRLNVSVIAYNWNLPTRYVPNWMEVWISITLVTIGVLAFRWIANRMPILREDPRFPQGH